VSPGKRVLAGLTAGCDPGNIHEPKFKMELYIRVALNLFFATCPNLEVSKDWQGLSP
jgi:hypothetical protein